MLYSTGRTLRKKKKSLDNSSKNSVEIPVLYITVQQNVSAGLIGTYVHVSWLEGWWFR